METRKRARTEVSLMPNLALRHPEESIPLAFINDRRSGPLAFTYRHQALFLGTYGATMATLPAWPRSQVARLEPAFLAGSGWTTSCSTRVFRASGLNSHRGVCVPEPGGAPCWPAQRRHRAPTTGNVQPLGPYPAVGQEPGGGALINERRDGRTEPGVGRPLSAHID